MRSGPSFTGQPVLGIQMSLVHRAIDRHMEEFLIRMLQLAPGPSAGNIRLTEGRHREITQSELRNLSFGQYPKGGIWHMTIHFPLTRTAIDPFAPCL